MAAKITPPQVGFAFAFNPIPLHIENDSQSKVEVNIQLPNQTTPIKLVRNTIQCKDNKHRVTFDLSGIARSLFDRDDFYIIEETDNTLCKTLTFDIFVDDTKTQEDSYTLPVIWGALQIGETYTQSKRLTAFRGYPFTVPLFNGGDDGLDVQVYNKNENIDVFGRGFGKHNINIDKFLEKPNNELLLQIEGVTIDPYFASVEFNRDGYHCGTSKSVGKKVQKSIQLYAPFVDTDKFDFLMQLVQSPVVDLFMGRHAETHQEQWMGVKTQAGSFAKASDHLQDFEFTLVLPEVFTQNL